MSIPTFGFAYNTGVKNMRNVISIGRALPISLATALNKDRINPRPTVKNKIGIMINGISRIPAFGVIL